MEEIILFPENTKNKPEPIGPKDNSAESALIFIEQRIAKIPNPELKDEAEKLYIDYFHDGLTYNLSAQFIENCDKSIEMINELLGEKNQIRRLALRLRMLKLRLF
ncbi:MAG: hypothetical protein FJX30_01815 [Alphaproteobacteria bacterium]|nr:hypothetical protein [Alphaproteobacteria bacterium]